MPFDFPNSPVSGDVYSANGVAWQYDGEKWKGGLPATQSDEQFFVLDGSTAFDVTVPTWAKACEFAFSVQIGGGANYFCARLSFDGTTFMAGASDYMNGGPVLNSGTSAYAAFGQQAASVIMLGVQGDNAGQPHQGKGVINTSRAVNMAVPWRVSSRMLDSGAASLHRTWESSGYLNATPTGGSLVVQKIRFLRSDGGAIPAGSWLKVKWIGDLNALPQSGAIVDAPSDGAEYVRVSGVWRKKCETFTWSSRLNTKGINCPAGATKLRAVIFVANPTPQQGGNLGFQASQDGGATWITTATSYYTYGLAADSGNASALNQGATATTYAQIGWMTNNTSVGAHSTLDLNLARNGSTHTWHAFGGGYYDTTSLARTWVINGYASTGFNGALPINALLFFLANSNMDAGSIECTWGYG